MTRNGHILNLAPLLPLRGRRGWGMRVCPAPSPFIKGEGELGAFRWLCLASMFLVVAINSIEIGQLHAQAPNLQPPSNNLNFQQLQSTLDTLLPKIRPAVVCIECGGGSGSGVIVSADGLVLTAAHVIDKAQELTIVYPDGRRFPGKALGTYGPADAGMAQILEGAPHPFVGVATGKDIKRDDTVIALGHPGGFDEQRGTPLRIGHILDINENFIETDTALIGGDSGGPTFDLNGNVIGIHSHISDQLHVNSDGNIASFLATWDVMREGRHDKIHYSQSLDQKEKKEAQRDSPWESSPASKPKNAIQRANDKEGASRASPLRSLAEEAKRNGGSLKLSREELLRMRRGLAARTESLAPAGGLRLIDDWARQWFVPFQPSVASVRKSVHKILVAGRTVSLGTAVHADGLLVTKASEIKGKTVAMELEPNDFRSAEIIAVSESLDLALIKVNEVKLNAVHWNDSSRRLGASNEMGSLCAAVGVSDQPVGFGVLSVAQRSLDGKSGAYLGVTIAPDGSGVRIVDIKPNSPAVRAGLKATDRIKSVDGEPLTTNDQLTGVVAARVPGDSMRIDIERGDTQLTLLIKLGDGAILAPMPGAREQAIDSESTLMSKRRWFFTRGLQHDCAISAKDCGGPLIDLDGRLLGINIARAGRIQSYAIPISDVASFLLSNHVSSSAGVQP
jgi:serine protease Do